MIQKIKNFTGRNRRSTKMLEEAEGTVNVDMSIREKFIQNPEFPFLISYPRTGSHWLRQLMELYFEKPSLARIFYYPKASSFTCYHRHDEDLSIKRSSVLYLYRHPIPTIFSLINYWKENARDPSVVDKYTDQYGRHLAKWLVEERFTTHKTILTYENLKDNLSEEFAKVCDHFGESLDESRLIEVANSISKEKLESKIKHQDSSVINSSGGYQENRVEFAQSFGQKILESIQIHHPQIPQFNRKF